MSAENNHVYLFSIVNGIFTEDDKKINDYRDIISSTEPMFIEDKKSILCYRRPQDKEIGKLTKMKVGRYFSKILGIELRQQDRNLLNKDYLKDELKFTKSVELWHQAYSKCKSCMTKCSHVVRAFVSSYYNLPDNGLSLAYLGTIPKIKSRAIVDEEKKTYLIVYGDKTLELILQDNGFKQDLDMMQGRIIALLTDKDGKKTCPFIDGNYQYVYKDRINDIPCLVVTNDDNPDVKVYGARNTDGILNGCIYCNDNPVARPDVYVYTVAGESQGQGLEWDNVCLDCIKDNYPYAKTHIGYRRVRRDKCVVYRNRYYSTDYLTQKIFFGYYNQRLEDEFYNIKGDNYNDYQPTKRN